MRTVASFGQEYTDEVLTERFYDQQSAESSARLRAAAHSRKVDVVLHEPEGEPAYYTVVDAV